jgi:hypothetical protein
MNGARNEGGTGSYRSEGGRGLTMISHIGQKHATLSIPLLFPPLFFFYEKDIDGSLPSSHCLSYSCTSWPVRLSASCQRREQARVTTVQVFKGTPSLDLETSVIILRKSLTLKNSTFCPYSVFICSIWITELSLFCYTVLTYWFLKVMSAFTARYALIPYK